MTTLVFNTLQYAKKLKEVGFTDQQAEVQAEVIADIIEEKLVNKQDLQDAKQELQLRILELKNDLIKWVLGATVAQATTIIACLKLIH